MVLTDTFVKNVKSARAAGDNYADGDGMYLLVKPSAKHWRLDYRFLGKRKTLALGVHHEVSRGHRSGDTVHYQLRGRLGSHETQARLSPFSESMNTMQCLPAPKDGVFTLPMRQHPLTYLNDELRPIHDARKRR